MTKALIWIIKVYQKTPISNHFHCKYYPTCSSYSIESFETYGFFKGFLMTIKRVLKCNPFSKGGIDLVKKENYEKNNIND
ncbi:MAG: membrane protein insertion efficiency factor YidD [Bacilli bacterium]